mgnify:CR=1 FL=1
MVELISVFAAAIQQEGFDIVLAGNQSTDGRGGMIPSMVAELLGVPGMPDLPRTRGQQERLERITGQFGITDSVGVGGVGHINGRADRWR